MLFEMIFKQHQVPVVRLGTVTAERTITMSINQESILKDSMVNLRDVWEATSFEKNNVILIVLYMNKVRYVHVQDLIGT